MAKFVSIKMKKKTIILGAGISGLSAAHFLSKKSDDFIILEESNKVGGWINSEIIDGYTCENGPNTVLLNNTAFLELLKDLNLDKEICNPQESAADNRYVLHQNKLQKIPTNLWEFFVSPLLKLSDKLILLSEPFVKKHKTNTSVASFCINRFGVGLYEQLIIPFVTGIYAGNPEKMSVKHALKSLWEMEQKYGSVFKGFLKKQKLQQKNDLPKVKMFTLKKGLSQLTDSIGENLEKKLFLNTRVIKIEKVNSVFTIHTNNGVFECEQIICTLPANVTSKLIMDNSLVEKLQDLEYVPVDVFHFGFNKNQIKNQFEGFGLLTKKTDEKHFLGMLFNSQIFPHTAPKEKELFTLIVGGSRQAKLCQMQPNELQKILLKEVSEILSVKGNPNFIKHERYKKAIPQYGLDHQELVEDVKKYQVAHTGFYFLSNYIDGVSVSDRVLKSYKLINNF